MEARSRVASQKASASAAVPMADRLALESPPFLEPLHWSSEAPLLRQLVVADAHEGRKIWTRKEILALFTDLSLDDAGINVVGEGLHELQNLTQLSLTGNHLDGFRGADLPPTLQVACHTGHRLVGKTCSPRGWVLPHAHTDSPPSLHLLCLPSCLPYDASRVLLCNTVDLDNKLPVAHCPWTCSILGSL